MLALKILGGIIFFYGLLSLIRDIYDEYTYTKVNNNMKIYITLEKVDENIEYFIREISNIKRKNQFRNITIINLDNNNDDIIFKKLKEEEIDIKILDNEELSVLNLIIEHNALTYNELIKLVNFPKKKILLTLNKLLGLNLIRKNKIDNKIYFMK